MWLVRQGTDSAVLRWCQLLTEEGLPKAEDWLATARALSGPTPSLGPECSGPRGSPTYWAFIAATAPPGLSAVGAENAEEVEKK